MSSEGVFRKDGIYTRRLFWWFPWGVTRWWLPRIWGGANEWCNESVCINVPPFGALVLFWRWPWRTEPCPSDWALMDAEQRADYAPCGWLYNGRLHPEGHHHFRDGLCEETR